MEDFVKKLAEVESRPPLRVVVTSSPVRNEFVFDAVARLDIVNHLDDSLVHGLVQVDVGWRNWILGWQQELEADGTSPVLQFDRELAAQLNAVVLFLILEANGDNRGFNCVVALQKGIKICFQLVLELVSRAVP